MFKEYVNMLTKEVPNQVWTRVQVHLSTIELPATTESVRQCLRNARLAPFYDYIGPITDRLNNKPTTQIPESIREAMFAEFSHVDNVDPVNLLPCYFLARKILMHIGADKELISIFPVLKSALKNGNMEDKWIKIRDKMSSPS